MVPFAFSIFDDADNATVENVAPVYRLLEELGLRTTKSVWPLAGSGNPGVHIEGASLEDPEHVRFVLGLQQRGFEVALHGVQNGSATRERTQEGLARFTESLGHHPYLHTNHSRNRDSIYWGADRFGPGLTRWVMANGQDRRQSFEGHIEGSPYFWGDLCREKIKYVRNLVFDETNLNLVNRSMPYRDQRTPYVQYWFSSTEGSDVQRFCRALSEPRQDALEAQEGVCIMYTHFASGFVEGGKVHPRFEQLMRRLAKKPGWFAPVGELLDSLLAKRGGSISQAELKRMELKWLGEKMLRGRT